MTGSVFSRRPSPRWGVHQVPRLWRLVVACWAVSLLSFLPAMWVVNGAVSPALENLPDVGVNLPDHEVQLIARGAVGEVGNPLRLAVLSGALTLWLWTVLWHAGMVNWTLWTGGRRLRLGELLGLGVVSWWRYARLSLLSAAAVIAGGLALSVPLGMADESAYRTLLERGPVPLVATGAAFAVLLWVVWAITVRAAWLVGVPERRSVVVAWLLALAGTLRTPLASLGTVALWTLPAVALSAVPLVVGVEFPALREGWAVPLLGQLAAAARAFCWVGLVASFAPVTGLLGSDPASGSDDARSAG